MRLSRRWSIVCGIYGAILLAIFVLAYRGILPVKLSAIPFYDTIGHFVLLGSASYLGHKAIGGRMLDVRWLPFAIPLAPLIVTIFAGIDEIFQAFSPLRTASLSDMSANLMGIWFFYYLATRK